MLEDLEKHAIELIRSEVSRASRPIVSSSFGKDSMVMLDLVKRAGYKLPVLFMREPFFPEKYAFANKVILENGYVVYDYPPLTTGVVKRNGTFEVANRYQVGTTRELCYLPTGVVEPTPGKPCLCGLRDLVNKPKGTFSYPWDMELVGHKSSDVDPINGPIPLKAEAVTVKHLRLVFPLKDFTDDDIWEYHRLHGLPIHTKRYKPGGGEWDDKTFNPDYFPACMRCLDPDEEKKVFCPMLQRMVDNISELAKTDPSSVSYVEAPDDRS